MVTATILNDGRGVNHNSIHLSAGGNKNLLLDCGDPTYWRMKENGINPHKIDVGLLTHKHGDHIRGIPQVAVRIGNLGQEGNPKELAFYAPEGTAYYIEHKLRGESSSRNFLAF